MQVDILTAIIALLGVLLSAFISYRVSLRQTKIEFDKHSEQIKQEFSRRLFEKRMSVYPELYSFLSNFGKSLVFGTPSKKDLELLFSQIQNWDSLNAILFSAPTGLPVYHLRIKIYELLKKPESELSKILNSPEDQKNLIREIQEVELALKTELGIYAIESPTKIKDFASYKTYREVTDSIV